MSPGFAPDDAPYLNSPEGIPKPPSRGNSDHLSATYFPDYVLLRTWGGGFLQERKFENPFSSSLCNSI